MKRAHHKAIADGLQARVNLRRDDVVVSLAEVGKACWSFGNGDAQLAQ